jgi:MYXO-CTERM domain-containing protein
MTPRDSSAKDQEKAAQKAGDDAAQAVKDETGVGDRPPSDPDELRQEIEETREDLGETVEALADKADVKAQAQEKVKETQEQAKAKVSEVTEQAKERPTPIAAGAAVALGLLAIVLWRRRK